MVSEESVSVSTADMARALMHPAREHALELLSTNGPMTATELAEPLGLSPSAVSWHLRLLERHCLVQRAEASTDARERPWLAVTGAMHLDTWSADLLPDLRHMITAAVNRAFVDVAPYADDRASFWLGYGKHWYSRAEVAEMRDRIKAVLAEYGSMDRRDVDDVRFATFFLGAQIDEADIDESSSSGGPGSAAS